MTDESAIIDPKRLAHEKGKGDVAPENCDSDGDDDFLISEWKKIKNEIGDYRHGMIKTLPNFAVNNSSNLLGAAHVATEILMFKAAAKDGVLVKDPTGPIDFTKRASKYVFKEITEGARVGGEFKISDLFKGNPIKNIYNLVTDTEAATQRELNMLKPGQKLKLANAWQMRATMFGLTAWTLSAIIPDKKDSPEDIERMSVMQKTNMPGYVAERIREAVWVPQWPDHKRQMIGLGVFSAGVCQILGAWRNRGIIEGVTKYRFDKGYLMTGIFSFLSSFPLLFATDDEKGFSGFGTLMAGRLFFLPGSISRKFSKQEGGAISYALASGSFQAENLAQILVGGAEKKPDGTIVDHQEVAKEAKRKAALERQERKARAHQDTAGEGAEIADAAPKNQLMEVASHTPPDKKLAHSAVS